MKTTKPAIKSAWEKTDTSRLLRHKQSRRYYARFTLNGKQKWVNLDTTVLSVAKLRLTDQAKHMEGLRAVQPHVEEGRATVGELMALYLQRTHNRSDLKPSSKVSRETALKKIMKTWSGIENLDPKDVTATKVQDWAEKFKKTGTQFRNPNSYTIRKGNSATSVNRSIDTLRRVLDIAVASGQIYVNPVTIKPAEGRLKMKVTSKKLKLPSHSEVQAILDALKAVGERGGWGLEAHFLCRFLMMSGARIGEVPLTVWRYVNWAKNELYLPGYKTETSARFLPLFPELSQLLHEIIAWRKATAHHRRDGNMSLENNDPIFRIRECQKSIDAACKSAGATRMTHHDWRHLFASICIEAGVDIPTISKWMGHNDGGTLVMKTYGHLRREHGQQAALKVKFRPPTF